MAKKKDKKTTEKRRAKAKHEKQKKRHLKLLNERQKAEALLPIIERPSFADFDPPDGFRVVSVSQALMEFGKPFMEDIGDTPDALNDVFGIINAIWNYEIMLKEGAAENLDELAREIVIGIQSLLRIKEGEAVQLLQEMVDRKQFLLPDEIQPDQPMVMFIRKELSHLIARFHYGSMSFSEALIPADEQDYSVIDQIRKMDQYIIDGAQYDEWEEFYFSLEEASRSRFEKWLKDKGSTEQSETFACHIELFLNFIYRYMHDDLVILRSVPPAYIEEFLFDFLLRKLIAEPHEYVTFPPALKFFYRFLFEKGYMTNPEGIIEAIDVLEADFIDVLRERFG